jgi:RNA polymerase sigma-70 factor (ECF subfamily)
MPKYWQARGFQVSDERQTAEQALWVRYEGRIRAYGLRHLRESAAAQDLVQHVLLSVLQAVRENRVDDPSRLDAYVLGTCRYAVMDIRRGTSRRQRLGESLAVLPTANDSRWEPLDSRNLERCLGELEARERAVVVATFIDDRDSDDIASSMELSVGNIRVIRHRALGKLRGCMDGGVS